MDSHMDVVYNKYKEIMNNVVPFIFKINKKGNYK